MFQELLKLGNFLGHFKAQNWKGRIYKAVSLLTCVKGSDILYKTI